MSDELVGELEAGMPAAAARVTDAYATAEPDAAADLLDAIAGSAARGVESSRGVLIDIVVRHRLAERPIRRVLLDHDDVDDALQNTLIGVAERIDRFEGRSRFTTWLHTVARNEALMVLRRRRRPVEDTVEVTGEEPGFVERLSSVIVDRARVRAAVDALPVLQREVLVLREFDGLEYAEIADRLGLPIGTVRSRINRARAMLAEALLVTSTG